MIELGWEDNVAEAHNAHKGCTWSMDKGNLAGTKGFAVSRKYRGVAVYRAENPLTALFARLGLISSVRHEITGKMVRDAWLYLGRPTYFGTWYDEDAGRSVMERVVVLETFQEALIRGAREGSRYIFDLERGKAVPIK